MIAKLTGLLDAILEDGAVIDVGGVGYRVYCSSRTLGGLPSIGETVSLLVETHVREDHIHLYGFAGAVERAWFRLLLTVQGVGARVALAILSALTTDELVQAVTLEDRAPLTRAAGVGAKLAARVVSELKDRAADPALGGFVVTDAAGLPSGGAVPIAAGGPAGDAVSALVNLGYRRPEAAGAVAHAARALGPEAPVEDLIRVGLQELGA